MDMLNGKGLTDEKRAYYKKYWDEIYHLDSPIDDYGFLRDAINNRHLQLQTYTIIDEFSHKLVHATSNQSELVKQIRDRINAIDNLEPESYCLTISLDKALEKSMEHIINRRDHPENETGIMTGIRSLDEIYLGFPRGSYTIITGSVNGGKTTLMFNIAFNMAKLGYNVVYVTLEKAAVPMAIRLHSLHAMVDYNRIKRGGKNENGLCEPIYNDLKAAYDDLKDRKINFELIQLPQTVKLSKILAEVEKVKSKMKIDVLVVDYLGAIGFEVRYPGRPDLDMAQTSIDLQAYCRKNDMAGISALQMTNSSTKAFREKGKKITSNDDIQKMAINTEDMSVSQRIIADADQGIGIFKDERDYPPTKAFITITKARDAEKGKVIVLDFNGSIGRISDPEFAPGQIIEVDDIIYNKNLTPADIASNDDLFSGDSSNAKADLDDSINSLDTNTTTTMVQSVDIDESESSEIDDLLDIEPVSKRPSKSEPLRSSKISKHGLGVREVTSQDIDAELGL
jgi:replicative DNA helicase